MVMYRSLPNFSHHSILTVTLTCEPTLVSMYTAKRKDVPVDSAAFLRHKLTPVTQVAQTLYIQLLHAGEKLDTLNKHLQG